MRGSIASMDPGPLTVPAFMQDPQIPNFYLANLETPPFYGIMTNPLVLQPVSNKKVA